MLALLVIEKCDLDNHKRVLPMLGFSQDRFRGVAHMFMIRGV
jgi:hypothetical protein